MLNNLQICIKKLSHPDDDKLSIDVKNKTIILVPVSSHIESECDESLRKLESDGILVYRKYGFSAIDQGRCVMAQQAIDQDYEHIFWIDSDVGFNPSDVYRIINTSIREKLPFITATYSVKGWPALTTKFHDKIDEVILGEGGNLYEIEYGATGFMYTHVSVYDDIKDRYKLTPVNIWGGQYKVHAWFLPMIIEDDYVGEDFAFCYRSRMSGITIYCDTTIRLSHIGKYSYSWEFLNEQIKSEVKSINFKV